MSDEELKELLAELARDTQESRATFEAKLAEKEKARELLQAQFEERSRSQTQVVNLAFALIASATVAVVVKIAFGS